MPAQGRVQKSEYGKSLPASGTIRILVLFAEIEYDVNPTQDPLYNVTLQNAWPLGVLPSWRNELFDTQPSEKPLASLTRFFYENSFGNYIVLGDYINKMFTIKESAMRVRGQTAYMTDNLLSQLGDMGKLVTNSGLIESDFDLWSTTGYGIMKTTPSVDNPPRLDHVMVIYRNAHTLNNQSGFASHGSIGNVCGRQTDTYSTFRSSDVLPFNIAKHEYVHLLLGDNNFHAGGGNGSRPTYHLCYQGGWSLLGGANSSLLGCNGWDRDRLNWKPDGKKHSISAMNAIGQEIITDLDAENSPAQRDVFLRDFMITGDAVRIRIPLADTASLPQYLWIENHLTSALNGTLSDFYQYAEAECTEKPKAGLYMYQQTGKHIKAGSQIYSGYADYIKPLPADGHFDLVYDKKRESNACVNSVTYYPFERRPSRANPFTGNHGLEFALFDMDNNGTIDDAEKNALAIERIGTELKKNLAFLGDGNDAFTIGGNRKIGMATNPSTAPTITHAFDNLHGMSVTTSHAAGTTDNKKILLNGVSAELINVDEIGTAQVRIRFDDTTIDRNVRWCADTIIVPTAMVLVVEPNNAIMIDRGRTPTRTTNPSTWHGELLFTNPTIFVVDSGAAIRLQKNTRLIASNESSILLRAGAALFMAPGSKIDLNQQAALIVDEGANVWLEKRAYIEIDKSSTAVISTKALHKKRCARWRQGARKNIVVN